MAVEAYLRGRHFPSGKRRLVAQVGRGDGTEAHNTEESAIHAAMVIRPFQTGIPDEQDTRAATSDELL